MPILISALGYSSCIKWLTLFSHSTVGVLYGTTNVMVGHPFDTIKTKMQAQKGFENFSMMRTLTSTVRQQGIVGLYRWIVVHIYLYNVYCILLGIVNISLLIMEIRFLLLYGWPCSSILHVLTTDWYISKQQLMPFVFILLVSCIKSQANKYTYVQVFTKVSLHVNSPKVLRLPENCWQSIEAFMELSAPGLTGSIHGSEVERQLPQLANTFFTESLATKANM